VAGRVTQQPLRVALVPDDANARVTQQPIRVAVVPNDANARVTQQGLRVAIVPTSSGGIAISGPSLSGSGTVSTVLQDVTGTGAVAFSGPSLSGLGSSVLITGTGAIAIGGPSLAGSGVVLPQNIGSGSVAFGLSLQGSGSEDVPEPGEAELKAPQAISIRYDGDDITDDVIIADASFMSIASGQPGPAMVRVRDRPHHYPPGYFHTGGTLELYINGRREWDGWVMDVSRHYAFDVDNTEEPAATPRFWVLRGADRNLLFQRRVIFNLADPASPDPLPLYPVGTLDKAVIDDFLAHFVEVADDGLDLVNDIQAIASPGDFQEFRIASVGLPWQQLFDDITQMTGGVYYIGPDRVLHYVDDESVTAPFGLSDQPGEGQIGYREMEVRSSADAMANRAFVWGAGKGSPSPVFARSEDQDSIDLHGPFEWANQYPGAWLQRTVQRRADTYIYGSPHHRRGHKDDQDFVGVTIFSPGIRAAQVVAFESQAYGYTDNVPVRSVRISFPTPGHARWELALSHTLDTPFGVTDPWELPPPPPSGWPCVHVVKDVFDHSIPSINVFADEIVWGADMNVPWTDPRVDLCVEGGTRIGPGGWTSPMAYSVAELHLDMTWAGSGWTDIILKKGWDLQVTLTNVEHVGFGNTLIVGTSIPSYSEADGWDYDTRGPVTPLTMTTALVPSVPGAFSLQPTVFPAPGFEIRSTYVDSGFTTFTIPFERFKEAHDYAVTQGGPDTVSPHLIIELSPGWLAVDGFVCDRYYDLAGLSLVNGHPPSETGQLGGGRARIAGDVTGLWIERDPTAAGTYHTPGPYLPGTLQVFIDGVQISGFVESFPPDGEFTISVGSGPVDEFRRTIADPGGWGTSTSGYEWNLVPFPGGEVDGDIGIISALGCDQPDVGATLAYPLEDPFSLVLRWRGEIACGESTEVYFFGDTVDPTPWAFHCTGERWRRTRLSFTAGTMQMRTWDDDVAEPATWDVEETGVALPGNISIYTQDGLRIDWIQPGNPAVPDGQVCVRYTSPSSPWENFDGDDPDWHGNQAWTHTWTASSNFNVWGFDGFGRIDLHYPPAPGTSGISISESVDVSDQSWVAGSWDMLTSFFATLGTPGNNFWIEVEDADGGGVEFYLTAAEINAVSWDPGDLYGSDSAGVTLDWTRQIVVRMHAGPGTTLQARVWNLGDPEPAAWHVECTNYAKAPASVTVGLSGRDGDSIAIDQIDFTSPGEATRESPVALGGTRYRTTFPYVAGTLQVFSDGIALQSGVDFIETDPAAGIFTVTTAVVGVLTVTYVAVRDRNPDPTPAPDGVTGNRVYRPEPLSQMGWGTAYDSENCNITSGCMCLDRHTLGALTSRVGTPRNDPPHMRTFSGRTDHEGTNQDDLETAWRTGWDKDYVNPGVIYWEAVENYINQGRGAVVSGLCLVLPDQFQHGFTGGHSVYVNEQFGDGSFWVVDPIIGRARNWPREVLRRYAEALLNYNATTGEVSHGHIICGFSWPTPISA
jgi:hypothetical protein